MQAATTAPKEEAAENANREVKRLTPLDYSKMGLVKLYDWSVKEREAHDKIMEKYRKYLMRLSNEVRQTNKGLKGE